MKLEQSINTEISQIMERNICLQLSERLLNSILHHEQKSLHISVSKLFMMKTLRNANKGFSKWVTKKLYLYKMKIDTSYRAHQLLQS